MTKWLERHKLHAHGQLFFDEGITFKVLARMSKGDLAELGIRKFGERKTLFDAIQSRESELYEELKALLDDLDVITPSLSGEDPVPEGDGGAPDEDEKPAPCPFEDAGEFKVKFDQVDDVVAFKHALCKDCDWKTARERGVDCSGSRRVLRRLMRVYHPDKVQSSFPSCTMNLTPWATMEVVELTQDLNKFCRQGGRRKHEDL
jgi:hypothetical protein